MTETPTPDVVALARRRYAEGAVVKAILAEAGITLGLLYRCLAGHFPDGSGIKPGKFRCVAPACGCASGWAAAPRW
jgi:hypothetical protein